MIPSARIRRGRGDRLRLVEAGFTLLEVMAALVIFTVGIVGVLALFATGLALHQDAADRIEVGIATEEVRTMVQEALENLGATDADIPEWKGTEVPGRPGCYFDVELSIDPDQGLAGGVMAEVFVYTVDGGRKRGERFTVFAAPGQDPERWIRSPRADATASEDGKPDDGPR